MDKVSQMPAKRSASCLVSCCGRSAALLLVAIWAAGCSRAGTTAPAGAGDETTYYGYTSQVRGFDPVKAGDVPSALAISKVYEGLVQYRYLARPYQVEPCLAEAMPEVSADGLVYTFRIRKGIFFQDDPCFRVTGGKGRELVAEDFVYSLKRLADMKNEATGWWVFNGRIQGLDEFHEKSKVPGPTDYAAPVDGLKAPDRHTLQIRLTKPYPQLLWVLTMQYAFAVPREAVDYYGREFVNHAVGTGPYRLKSFQREYRIEFVRSPKWAETGRVESYPSEGAPGDREAGLLDDAGKPIPFIDRIVEYVVDDDSTQWLMFVTGQLDASGISRGNWNAVITPSRGLTEGLKRMGVRLHTTPSLDTFYIGFNMDDPVVGHGKTPAEQVRNRKLRQALTCAFNSERWVRFWNNRVARATGPIPPGIAGYESGDSPYPFDLPRAKRLLAEAGYPDGKNAETGQRLKLSLELGSANDPDTRQAVELLIDFMNELGVLMTPSYNNWPAYLGKLERRQVQMFWLGWVADYPDAENFLQLFYGPNSSPGPNHCNYVNAEFDRLYERVAIMQDTPERTAIYRRMAAMIVEDAPWIFMHHPMSYGLQHGWVRNQKPHDFPYGMNKYRAIDARRRGEWKQEFRDQNWRAN